MSGSGDRIYPLIPAIYRQRDAALGGPLKALSKVLEIEYQSLQENIEALYDQWFIETCSQWAVPYIGGLLGVAGIDTPVANVPTQRTRVANTLGYRSRRGTSAILANVCADASGWPALPVEYFQRIITSVNVGAIELARSGAGADNLRHATINIGDPRALAYLSGPFSRTTRTVSVGAINQPVLHVAGSTPEYYNLPNLGLFFWRIPALPIVAAAPGKSDTSDTSRWTFHPLGIETPLLQAPVDRTSPWLAPGPANMPMAITRLMLAGWLDMWRQQARAKPPGSSTAGPPLGFTITVDGKPVLPAAISVSPPCAAVAADPLDVVPRVAAVVDPERGWFELSGEGVTPSSVVTVDWAWGQPGWIGGGGYDRDASMIPADHATIVFLVSSAQPSNGDQSSEKTPAIYGSLDAVYAAFLAQVAEKLASLEQFDVLIRILDSGTYPSWHIDLPDQARLAIQALDGQRPTILAVADAEGVSLGFSSHGRARVVLSGLLLVGCLDVSGDLDLQLLDMTVAPVVNAKHDVPAIRWELAPLSTSNEPTMELLRCIVGPLVLGRHVRVTIAETIVDGRGGRAISGPDRRLGAPLRLRAVSVLGDVDALALDQAQDVIVTGQVRAHRLARAVLKAALFALALVNAADPLDDPAPVWSRPSSLPPFPFTSTRYGDPGYCQLRLDAGAKVLRGGTGGAELGAYSSLASGQRLANLEPLLTEYTPFGLEVGVFIMSQMAMPSETTQSTLPPDAAGGKAAAREG